MTTLILVAVALCGLGVLIHLIGRDRERDASPRETPADWQAHYEQVQSERRARLDEAGTARWRYLDEHAAEWPTRVVCRVDGKRSDLMLAADGRQLRVVPGRDGDHFDADAVWDMRTADIAALRIERQQVDRYVTRSEQVVLPTANRKSPAGRALIGGLLLGPIGAVAGAASGLKAPDAKVTTQTHRDRTQVEGKPLLLIETRQIDRPVVRIELESMPLAEECLARLRHVAS